MTDKKVLDSLSKEATWVISELIVTKDTATNTVNFSPENLSKNAKLKFIVGINELLKKSIVREIVDTWYMINPNVLPPNDSSLPAAKTIWEGLE